MGNNTYSNVVDVGSYYLNVGGTVVVLNDILYIIQMKKPTNLVEDNIIFDEYSGNEPIDEQLDNEQIVDEPYIS